MDNFQTDRGARIARIGDLAYRVPPQRHRGVLRDRRQLRRSDVAGLLSGAGGVARAARAAAHQRRHLRAALRHITMPRVFFPNKGELVVGQRDGAEVFGCDASRARRPAPASPSATRPSRTSISALPWMFLPVFGFALAMGMVYRDRGQEHQAPRAAGRVHDRDVLVRVVPLRTIVGRDARRGGWASGVRRTSRRAARSLPARSLRTSAGSEAQSCSFNNRTSTFEI